MKLPSFEPFVPKGSDFKRSQRFFQGLGFTITWDVIDYVGFDRDGCSFILQNYDHKEFAEQLMIRVKIESADNFWNSAADKNLVETYGVKVSKPSIQPYGNNDHYNGYGRCLLVLCGGKQSASVCFDILLSPLHSKGGKNCYGARLVNLNLLQSFFFFTNLYLPPQRQTTYICSMAQYSMGDAIKNFLAQSRLKGSIQALQIEDVWESVMGKTIARYTDNLKVINKTLFITTNVAPLKQELMYQKEKIKFRVNEAFRRKGDRRNCYTVTPRTIYPRLFVYCEATVSLCRSPEQSGRVSDNICRIAICTKY
jgi:hypothetical protein